VRHRDREPFAEADCARLGHFVAEVAPLPAAGDDDGTAALVGESPAMRELRKRLRRFAASDAPVLVTGASGTGKELVARAVHACSGRAGGPLVAVNCAALAANLIEAELFGHEKGAFTGADRARPGAFREADGGTLFLDEVGELAPELQPKLLRALERGEVVPVGATTPIAANVRVVAATNRDLRAAIDAGEFREDLFYRLDVLRLETPDLAARREDLPMLVTHLLHREAAAQGLPVPAIADDAMDLLRESDWPGNVRQLANTLARALALCDERIEPRHCELRPAEPASDPVVEGPLPTLAEVEARHVLATLDHCGWNKTRTAKMLGISRPTLLKKIADYGLAEG